MIIRIKKNDIQRGLLVLLTAAFLIGTSIVLYKEDAAVFLQTMGEIPYSGLIAPKRSTEDKVQNEKICYLTFDDGPSENTEKILDILEQYHAKATFFVIGNGLHEGCKDIFQRMKEEGHGIGLHANNHVYEKIYANVESFLNDYETLYTTLKEEYQIETALYRFPGGSRCYYLGEKRGDYLNQMKKRGFACFDWNVSGEDAVGKPTVGSIQEQVFSHVFHYNVPIILLHDSSMADATVEALPGILEKMTQEGYVFLSLECAEEYIFR